MISIFLTFLLILFTVVSHSRSFPMKPACQFFLPWTMPWVLQLKNCHFYNLNCPPVWVSRSSVALYSLLGPFWVAVKGAKDSSRSPLLLSCICPDCLLMTWPLLIILLLLLDFANYLTAFMTVSASLILFHWSFCALAGLISGKSYAGNHNCCSVSQF